MHVRSAHVSILDSGVRMFCSAECRETAAAPRLPTEDVQMVSSGHSFLARLAVGALALAGVSTVAWPDDRSGWQPSQFAALVQSQQPAAALTEHGPPMPTETEMAEVLATQLAGEIWLHPLGGPRRMPVRSSRVFGAERPGDRPAECRSGHCGVDIGSTWGEPVFAVHAGIVDRVQNQPNPNRGGKYVRLAHRDNTIFSQYFHLAAISPRLKKGDRVRAGEVIGVVGQTGVEQSGPHLHFTLSVQPDPDTPEQYIDPEPLIALWPVRESHASLEVASAAPGRPLGAVGAPARAHKARPAKQRRRANRHRKSPAPAPSVREQANGEAEPTAIAPLPGSESPSSTPRNPGAGDRALSAQD
jgi:murein DD-endopeptidase MepM/ murein hydrolase activator NlpD